MLKFARIISGRGLDPEERYAGCLQRPVNETIPETTVETPMGEVVNLEGQDYPKGLRCADDKIDMFLGDEPAVPHGPRYPRAGDDVRKADLRGDHETRSDGLL